MDKILALLLSLVPNAHAQIVQNDAHSYKGEGHYVLDVTKANDDYSYTLKDKQNDKETRFSVESEINSNFDKNLAGFNKK